MNHSNDSVIQELRRLNVRRRNQVRPILYATIKDAIPVLNRLRKSCSANELYQIDKILKVNSGNSRPPVIPESFPQEIQVEENYHRLGRIDLVKQVSIVEILAKDNKEKLNNLIVEFARLSMKILEMDFAGADSVIGNIRDKFGFSNNLLRKTCLLHILNDQKINLPNVEDVLTRAGFARGNVISNAIVHAYQKENSFLSIKKSILAIRNKGLLNQYTRDMARMPFHPHAKNEEDLTNLVQSNLQSSLFDAVLCIGLNKLFIGQQFPTLSSLFGLLKQHAPSIEDVAALYLKLDKSEAEFYKQSSAWFEVAEIIEYRNLVDHYYDSPESTYFDLNEVVNRRVETWLACKKFDDLICATEIATHGSPSLTKLEKKGYVTRSAGFNYLVQKCQGQAVIDEAVLVLLMEQTHELDRTVYVPYIQALSINASSKYSKLIYLLLIAKKSRNDVDNFQLRRLIQRIAKEEFEGKLDRFIVGISKISEVIAHYTYEVCTEDFIAKLSHIVETASEITETRARLHQWMGESTGEKAYIDRARTLLIDHQINKIRNEIDDYRIYVDMSRFADWINDELIRELNSALTNIDHSDADDVVEDQQLIYTLDRCYSEFCNNRIFGIASYLGRRIRHGTFKGNLYSGVIAVGDKPEYERLWNDPVLSQKWMDWKKSYETLIDDIIVNRLHIESPSKRDGLIKATISETTKIPIVMACANALAKDYLENRSTSTAIQLISEYCWRIAEIDLWKINSYLKNKRAHLLKQDFINEFKFASKPAVSGLAKDFTMDLQHELNVRIQTMYGWFKRPVSVSPKASLSLLFKAVVAEVQETFPDLVTDTTLEEKDDVELIGGPYHVIYDAFYVVVYNAAKHGRQGELVRRRFELKCIGPKTCVGVLMSITSTIKDEDDDDSVNAKLLVTPTDDIENAQLCERRSGIKKLYQLEQTDPYFRINRIECKSREVTVEFEYYLDH